MLKIDATTGILYGFFANALDDDKKEVKICCLKTILNYGSSSSFYQFSKISFVYIQEMINDEEEEVRFEAMRCLDILLSNFKSLEVSK